MNLDSFPPEGIFIREKKLLIPCILIVFPLSKTLPNPPHLPTHPTLCSFSFSLGNKNNEQAKFWKCKKNLHKVFMLNSYLH